MQHPRIFRTTDSNHFFDGVVHSPYDKSYLSLLKPQLGIKIWLSYSRQSPLVGDFSVSFDSTLFLFSLAVVLSWSRRDSFLLWLLLLRKRSYIKAIVSNSTSHFKQLFLSFSTSHFGFMLSLESSEGILTALSGLYYCVYFFKSLFFGIRREGCAQYYSTLTNKRSADIYIYLFIIRFDFPFFPPRLLPSRDAIFK